MAASDQPDAIDMRKALRDYILEAISGVRVGIVQQYDQAQRVAVVQPVRRRKIFGIPQPVPPVRAPVGWWRFAGMLAMGEVQPGDEVLLVACEREIWPWYVSGQQHDPTSERMHDASDTIALPWISSVKRSIAARLPSTFYMGREDGSAGITITMGPAPGRTTVEGTGPGSIVLGSAAVSPVVLHQAYASAWATMAGTLAGLLTTLQAVAPAASAGTVITMANANNAAIEGTLTAMATFAGQVASMASVKTVAE